MVKNEFLFFRAARARSEKKKREKYEREIEITGAGELTASRLKSGLRERERKENGNQKKMGRTRALRIDQFYLANREESDGLMGGKGGGE